MLSSAGSDSCFLLPDFVNEMLRKIVSRAMFEYLHKGFVNCYIHGKEFAIEEFQIS